MDALLPLGAAYQGATPALLEQARKDAGELYYPSVFNPKTLAQKGPLRVAKDRVPADKSADGKPGFEMYYELHGTGPKRLLFVMGLNNSCFGWLQQVEAFGQLPEYSVLVMDNRGYGNSQAPKMRYKTSEFALDTFEVLEHVGWTEKASVHLLGVSMGGMIALEMARIKPDRFKLLALLSTTAGDRHNLPPWRGLNAVALGLIDQIFKIGLPDRPVNRVIDALFPQAWQDAPSDMDPKRTNREVTRPLFIWRSKFAKRPTLYGPLGQIAAALTHHVPKEALAEIDKAIPSIKIVTGDWDNLVDPSHSFFMRDHLPHAEFIEWKGAGHAIHFQFSQEFNQLVRKWSS